MRLQEYNFQIVHIPCKQNEVADALSRVDCAAFGVSYRRGGSLASDGCGPGLVPPSTRGDVDGADTPPSGSDPAGSISARDMAPADRFARVHNAVCGHHGVQATITMLKDAGLDFPNM